VAVDDLDHSTFALSILAGGNWVLDLEDIKFEKKGGRLKAKRDWMFSIGGALNGALERKLCRRVSGILACLGCTVVLVTFSLAKGAPSVSAQASQSQAQDTRSPSKSHGDVDLSSKSPDELAAYVFEHHHCDTCHTLGKGGKLGFNDRGKEVGKNFEGCISLLTSMNVIAQVKPADRTTEEKTKGARFQQFGCTTCHQITPGKLGLTEYGTKLKSLHMACTDVERILAK
jgi:cytochrome c2